MQSNQSEEEVNSVKQGVCDSDLASVSFMSVKTKSNSVKRQEEEEGAISQILQIQEMTYSQVSNLTRDAAAEKVAQAKEKLNKVVQFRDDIEDDVHDLMKQQQAIIEKVTKNLYNKHKSEGYLFHSREDYAQCLGKINMPLLMQMLDKDLMTWGQIAKGTEKTSNQFQSQIEAFLKEQKSALEDILKPDTFAFEPSAHLRKLPILSSQFNGGKIDF